MFVSVVVIVVSSEDIDIGKYVKKPKFDASELKDGCFLNDIEMMPLLIPDISKGEGIYDIVNKFTGKNAEMACGQLAVSGDEESEKHPTLYLSDFADDILVELAPPRKLVLTRDIVVLSGASKLINGYYINGRSVGAVLDHIHKERVRIKGWLKFGGIPAHNYISTVSKPANDVLYGLKYYNILDGMRNRAVYSSSVIGTVVNKFRDAFGSDTINNAEIYHLFILSAYTMHPNPDPRIKKVADEFVYYFLADLEEMDLHLKKLRKDGKIPSKSVNKGD